MSAKTLCVRDLLAIEYTPPPRSLDAPPSPYCQGLALSDDARARIVPLLREVWPPEGKRRAARLAFAGHLCHLGVDEAHAIALVNAFCAEPPDEDEDNFSDAVNATYRREDDGQTYTIDPPFPVEEIDAIIIEGVAETLRDLLDEARRAHENVREIARGGRAKAPPSPELPAARKALAAKEEELAHVKADLRELNAQRRAIKVRGLKDEALAAANARAQALDSDIAAKEREKIAATTEVAQAKERVRELRAQPEEEDETALEDEQERLDELKIRILSDAMLGRFALVEEHDADAFRALTLKIGALRMKGDFAASLKAFRKKHRQDSTTTWVWRGETIAGNVQNATQWLGLRGLDLAYNEMIERVEHDGVPMNDEHITALCADAEKDLNTSFSASVFHAAVEARARLKTYNPVKIYLEGLRWDGVPRIHTIAPKVWGDPRPIAKVITCKFLVAAVARTYEPACPVRNIPVLASEEQDIGKSYSFLVLGGAFYSDTTLDINNRTDVYEKLHSCWIYEWAEMSGLNKDAIAKVKAFSTATTDTFRPSYGRSVRPYHRKSVMCGTTNVIEFLVDDENTRFGCIAVDTKSPDLYPRTPRDKKLPVSWLLQNRDQLWAEAVHLYKANLLERQQGKPEAWLFTTEETEQLNEANQDFMVHRTDIYDDKIDKLVKDLPDDFTTSELMGKMMIAVPDRKRMEQAISKSLKQKGFYKARVIKPDGTRPNVWKRGPDCLVPHPPPKNEQAKSGKFAEIANRIQSAG